MARSPSYRLTGPFVSVRTDADPAATGSPFDAEMGCRRRASKPGSLWSNENDSRRVLRVVVNRWHCGLLCHCDIASQ